jgi:hypothetical protein
VRLITRVERDSSLAGVVGRDGSIWDQVRGGFGYTDLSPSSQLASSDDKRLFGSGSNFKVLRMSRQRRSAFVAEAMAKFLVAVVALGCSDSKTDGSQGSTVQSSGTGGRSSSGAANRGGVSGASTGSANGESGGATQLAASGSGPGAGGQASGIGGKGSSASSSGGSAASNGGAHVQAGMAGRVGSALGGSSTGSAGKPGAVSSAGKGGTGATDTEGTSPAGKGGAAIGGQASNAGRAGTAKGGAASGGAAVGGATTGASGASGGDVIATIVNGGFWNDTAGNRIEAHGGGFILVDGTWYWIGEDKSANSGDFKAVNCYSSKDLQHWKFENAIITKSTATELAASDRIIERPKVIYNDTTKQYVMWLHWEGQNYAEAKAGVFTSSTVCGDYTFKSAFRPNDNMSRDDTLFKDDDGKAYFMSAANENADMDVYELSSDYLSVSKQVATLWPGAKREGPAMFKQDGRYFLITSACTGWDSNQAQYSSATSIGGTWASLQNIGNSTTYDTQSTYVIPIVGTKTTTFVFAGDRWQDPDLQSSKYIWLPIKTNGTKLSLDYYAKWQLNLTTGEWSADVTDGYVPQTGWKLLHVDSEETQAEDGSATNAFDHSDSTIWHTQYTGSAPKHPHEIQIDLGATVAIKGMRCLPRQDKDDHGIIAGYEFYASEDATSWGSPVASGTFDSTRNEHIVSFSAMNAHYVRLVALSEINGNDWTSLAELDLVPAK